MLSASKLLSFLEEIRFSEQKFPADKLISDIKYYYLGFQKNNRFYRFKNQLDYTLINYFAESETIKDNIDRFLSNLLMVLLIKKLSYQNNNKWMKKLLEILLGICNNKWIKYKFKIESDEGRIVRQKIAISSENMVRCLKFLIRYSGF